MELHVMKAKQKWNWRNWNVINNKNLALIKCRLKIQTWIEVGIELKSLAEG